MQADGKVLERGSHIINTFFTIIEQEPISLVRFSMDAEVLFIRWRDMILGLSWLEENGFLVDIGKCRLEGKNGNGISCQERRIPKVYIMEGRSKLEDGDVVLIVDATSQYANHAHMFSSK